MLTNAEILHKSAADTQSGESKQIVWTLYLMRFLIKEQPLTDGKLDLKNRHGVIVPLLDWELMDDDITRTDSGDGIQPLSKTQAKFQLRFLLLFTYRFIFSFYIDIHCFFLILSLCC